ncbi:hypothetical protein IV55_GL000999 [Furfurilactobacillus siliginis]|uniref:Prepilin-type N-terminal cleavage/methylation domain-containing protein n=2 Tax=Furfurilactobacillus siliginis TaxID=348151 RepID=A0A0R2L263_9LACO|nr:hypothetical protein [Furfurilactobacillus siliginis]KRN93580.1 hypothetical protein IV55_GL000999 [Furfurilactobacillus siliginis]GEK29236.1 hypothetical protein LSI01_15470 [Furfurilactobacillus siliginis]
MLWRKSRAAFTLVETLVTLGIVTLSLTVGIMAFKTTRELQTERAFIKTVVSYVEQAKGQGLHDGQIKLTFRQRDLLYFDVLGKREQKLPYPQSLRVIAGASISFNGDQMIGPQEIVFKSQRGRYYDLKPQLGWGIIHVSEI